MYGRRQSRPCSLISFDSLLTFEHRRPGQGISSCHVPGFVLPKASKMSEKSVTRVCCSPTAGARCQEAPLARSAHPPWHPGSAPSRLDRLGSTRPTLPPRHPNPKTLPTAPKEFYKRILQQNSLAQHWARDWRALAMYVCRKMNNSQARTGHQRGTGNKKQVAIKEFKQNNSLSQHTGSTQVRTGAC